MTAAALVDQNELAELRIEQTQLIALLKNKDGSLKTKINRLAEIYERRLNLADPDISPFLTVNQISTEIANVLRTHRMAIADDVHHYLPDKYKNPNKQNFLPEDSGTKSRKWGGVDPELLIEELTELPKEIIEALPTEKKQILYDAITKSNGIKNILEADALKKGYQFSDKKLRGPIRTPRPFEPEATIYSDEIHKHALVLLEWEKCVIERCPPPKELAEEFARGERRAYQIYENFINEKYSLDLAGWLERDVYRVHQSKHGAAVKDKVQTLVCAKCSILGKNEYEKGDFVEAEWHWESPTHWKCPSCGNMDDFVLRPLTREQCGDKGHERCPQCNYRFNWDVAISPMETQAIDLVNNLPGYYNSLKYYNELMQKCVATRKVELGVDLSSKS